MVFWSFGANGKEGLRPTFGQSPSLAQKSALAGLASPPQPFVFVQFFLPPPPTTYPKLSVCKEKTIPQMKYLFLLLLFVFLFSASLSAQSYLYPPEAGFWLSGGAGVARGDDSQVGNGFGLQLDLNYQLPTSNSFSFFWGLGIQRRNAEIITATGEPCVFPLGLKVVTFTDAESFTANQLEGTVQAGASYHKGRLRLGAAIVPAFRLNNQLTYRYFRDFTQPDRPDAEVETTFTSGDEIELRQGGQRSVRYSDGFNLQADFSLAYQLSPRLRVAAAYRPIFSGYELEYGNQTICDFLGCELVELPETISTLGGGTAYLRVSYGL